MARRLTGAIALRFSICAAGTLVLLLVLAAPSSAAEAEAGALVGSPLDRAEVVARLAAVDGDPGLTEDERERLAGQYQRVLDHLAALAQAQGEAARLREEQAAAPAQTAAIRARQDAAARSSETVGLTAEADLAAVQELLAQETAAVAAYRDRLATLEQALTEGADALPRWRRELAERRQQVLDLDDELAGVQAVGADGLEAPARRWLLESERDRRRAEIQVLELELAGADVRRALTLAQRDEARLALDRALVRQAQLQAQEEGRRRDQAERVLAETGAAKEAAVDAHPRVRELARANAVLAEAIDEVDRRTAGVEAALAATVATSAALAQDFANDRRRISAAGLNRALGRVLIDRRERLPDLRELRRQAAERADAEAEATLAQLHWREELLALKAATETRFAADLEALVPPAAAALEAQLMQMAARQIGFLELAIAAEERQLRALAELNLAAESLHTLTRDYRAFLAEHLLWMRSHVPVTQQSFAALPVVLGELLRPSTWLPVAQTLGDGLADSWTWSGGLIVVALLLAFNRTLRRRIRATAEPLRRARTDRFGYTLWAILWTLLLAAPVSLLLALLGLVLTGTPFPEPFPYMVGETLLLIAPGLYYLRAFRLMCLTGGVAEVHFRWRSNTVGGLARYLDAAIWTLIPLGFVAAVVSPLGEVQAATLGRLALTGATLGFALLLAGALHPRRGLVREALAARPGGVANRMRYVWYPLAVAVPLALAVLTLAGFQYTAGILFHLWLGQSWLLLGLVVLQQAIVRWLLVTRRQLALRQVLERRARREAQQQDAAAPGEASALAAPGAGTQAHADDAALDLVALDGQTRRLVNALLVVGGGVGLWALWSDVLPALNVLERITLWSVSTSVDGVTHTLPITLADLASILVIAAVAIISVRHLPALLEILLVKNTGISAGGRYAISALTTYAITAIAVLSVAGRLGFAWQQVQWLVAALGVGIGFGLQEIVANFISGLIILFERPVRVGDIVTVGEQIGVVSRIEIRATTIRTLDQRELLVPNKQLITAEVINWTLSDQINRSEILVSIEYGSDTQAALRILREVATADPRVMTDPAPLVTAKDFGERGLDLMLRFCLPTVANRIRVRGELITAIDTRLRAAGIPIALPRRDIRLRDGDLGSSGVAPAACIPPATTIQAPTPG